MKAILVIDVDDIDIKNAQATYIELQCNNHTKQISLVNHWLKPLPQKKDMFGGSSYDIIENRGYNKCIDEILGEDK